MSCLRVAARQPAICFHAFCFLKIVFQFDHYEHYTYENIGILQCHREGRAIGMHYKEQNICDAASNMIIAEHKEGVIQLTYLLLSTATPTVLRGVAMLATKLH